MKWTAEQDAKLRDLKTAGLSYSEMAAHLEGRSPKAIASRWRYINLTPAEMMADLDKARIWKRENLDRGEGKRNIQFVDEAPIVVPPEVLNERAARLSAPKSLTGWLMGDPHIGWSALDFMAVAGMA